MYKKNKIDKFWGFTAWIVQQSGASAQFSKIRQMLIFNKQPAVVLHMTGIYVIFFTS